VSAPARLLDGEPLTTDASLLWDTRALLGDAVFETMRAYDGQPFMLDAHLARLARSAAWAKLDVGGPDVMAREVRAVASSIDGDAAVRVLLVRATRPAGTRRLVMAEPLVVDAALYARGITACTLPEASYGTLESPHAKYARYLPRLLAREEAEARGHGDALLVDAQGHIVSATMASVFCVVEGAVITTSVLEGITQAVVVSLAGEAGLSCARRTITRADIERASELFTSSSLREIVPVTRVDDSVVGTGSPGTITRSLHAALRMKTRVT
jgi:branched-chain amino acid aminotransferase